MDRNHKLNAICLQTIGNKKTAKGIFGDLVHIYFGRCYRFDLVMR